jgi:hypothetical protein
MGRPTYSSLQPESTEDSLRTEARRFLSSDFSPGISRLNPDLGQLQQPAAMAGQLLSWSLLRPQIVQSLLPATGLGS